MSKRRLDWKESLKPDVTVGKKRGKINILKDETYKNENGKLTLVSSIKTKKTSTQTNTINKNNTIQECTSTLRSEICTPEMSHVEEKFQFMNNDVVPTNNDTDTQKQDNENIEMTPRQLSRRLDVENLTPTFRKPDCFLAETKEVMKIITPVKLFPTPSKTHIKEAFKIIPPYDSEENEEIKHNFSNLNNITLALNEQNREDNNGEGKFSLDYVELPPDKSCSFSIQLEEEHDISQDKDDCIQDLIIEEAVTNENFVCIKKMTDDNNNIESCSDFNELGMDNLFRKGFKNMINEIDNNIVYFNKEANKERTTFEESSEILAIAQIHNEPRSENEASKDHHEIVKQCYIEGGDDIISIAEDETVSVLPRPTNETSHTASAYTQNLKINSFKRNAHYNKSYMDYMSDEDVQQFLDEAFPSEASSAEYDTEESTDTSNDESKKNKKNKKNKKSKQGKKITKKGIKNKTEDHNISAKKKTTKAFIWKENKKKKEMGESYSNHKEKLIEAKILKPNPCAGKNCGNDCGNITEEKRQQLFSYFWQLNSNQRRKDWIAQCAVKKAIKRPNKNNNTRSCAYDYFINEGEGRRRVCQKYLLSTLDITQRFILYTLENTDGGYAKTDGRVSNGGSNRTNEIVTEHANNFIESLPKMPSHYCRKDSKRLYFPEEFRNVSNLYRIYKDNCRQSEIKAMSFQVFRTWFKKSYNIGFHVPKKDKCAICVNTKNNEEKSGEETEKIQQHANEKDESYKRFKCHQNIHKKDKSIICASFDMQKVLNTPHGDSMMLYYSRKLSVYNFTIYESSTRRGYCNVWTEIDANRGANEICTCLYNYIKKIDSCGLTRTLLLYCDSCYGQNKNKFVLSMIRYVLSQCKNIKTIQINYLIPGHTYMPVDSVHATIETKIRKCIVWAPSQWPTIMELARLDPEPYKVEVLNGKDFIGFDDLVNSTFNKKQKLSISKLSIATFKNQEPNLMYIKNSMLPDAETITIPLSPLKNTNCLKDMLYPTALGISAKKYKDLTSLVNKNIIPSRFAAEYKNLKVSIKAKDYLMDTDEEDIQEIDSAN